MGPGKENKQLNKNGQDTYMKVHFVLISVKGTASVDMMTTACRD